MKDRLLSFEALKRDAKYANIFFVGIVSLIYACGQTMENSRPTQGQLNVLAGPNEENFTERYKLSISLPMPEKRFLELLSRLNLSYERIGGNRNQIPPPLHRPSLNLASIRACYQIYGDTGKVGKKYRAYIDEKDQVVYIENAFTYPVP